MFQTLNLTGDRLVALGMYFWVFIDYFVVFIFVFLSIMSQSVSKYVPGNRVSLR